MERKKYRVIFFLVFISCLPFLCPGQRSEIYKAYVNNRMDIWKEVIDRMAVQNPESNEMILELVNYQYGYIGYCIGFKKREEAKKYLALAERNVEILEARNYDLSTINAYKCAFYGFRIGLNKLTAPVNGLKSIEHARTALALNRDNYLAHIQYGNIQFYMPSAFGGSKQEGIEYFLRAREILERNRKDLTENWNYLSLLVIIGQSYTYINQPESAKAVYEEILNMEPGFSYVSNDLYPALLKKMNT